MALIPLSLPPWLALLIAGGVIASLAHGLKRHALLLDGDAIVELIWEEDGMWRLLTASGKALEGRLAHAAAYAHLVVLHFLTEGGRRSAVIFCDALDAASFRRLRMHLTLRG